MSELDNRMLGHIISTDLVDVLDKHVVQPIQHLVIVILVEAGEHHLDDDLEDNQYCIKDRHLDVLVQEQVYGGAPELTLQPGVDRHRHVRLLHLLGLDESKQD